MSRLALIWLTLYLLHLSCFIYSLAQDLSIIKPAIEKERELERIRNKIYKTLMFNGAKIYRSDAIDPTEPSSGLDVSAKKEIKTGTRADITTHVDTNRQSKPLITLGEPVSEAKHKCLAFHMRKYIPNVDYIVPKKLDLWIHIRKIGKKGKKSRGQRMLRIGLDQSKNGEGGIEKDRKKVKGKRRKRKQGRRIRIFISDGKRTLVKMRMRIRKTKWYKIELPISKFPDIISVNDSFKLCFKCKRCSKKITLDLYRKRRQKNHTNTVKAVPPEQQTIPFIHFEEHRSQHIFRHRRSNDVINVKQRHPYHRDRGHSHHCRHDRYTDTS